MKVGGPTTPAKLTSVINCPTDSGLFVIQGVSYLRGSGIMGRSLRPRCIRYPHESTRNNKHWIIANPLLPLSCRSNLHRSDSTIMRRRRRSSTTPPRRKTKTTVAMTMMTTRVSPPLWQNGLSPQTARTCVTERSVVESNQVAALGAAQDSLRPRQPPLLHLLCHRPSSIWEQTHPKRHMTSFWTTNSTSTGAKRIEITTITPTVTVMAVITPGSGGSAGHRPRLSIIRYSMETMTKVVFMYDSS